MKKSELIKKLNDIEEDPDIFITTDGQLVSPTRIEENKELNELYIIAEYR